MNGHCKNVLVMQ